jgi:hypothetical protein
MGGILCHPPLEDKGVLPPPLLWLFVMGGLLTWPAMTQTGPPPPWKNCPAQSLSLLIASPSLPLSWGATISNLGRHSILDPLPWLLHGPYNSQLVTDDRKALVSQFWEGQLCTSLKDGTVCYLFENTGSTYFGKGFDMLQVLEDNFHPLSISNLCTTLLVLLNDTQGNKEGIHDFWLQFEGHLGALSWLLVNIPPILQVMLFLQAMHS